MEIRPINLDQAVETWRQFETTGCLFPFQQYGYVAGFARQFCHSNDLLILSVELDQKPIAVLPLERQGKTARLIGMKPVLGQEELTDYGDIVTARLDPATYAKLWQTAFQYLSGIGITGVWLDYVREDSQLFDHFRHHQQETTKPQSVAPFIRLPSSWEVYLETLERTDRKELKRKLKRLETVPYWFDVGAVDRRGFDRFVTLHRRSDPNKEKFMSAAMVDYFWEMIGRPLGRWQFKLASLAIKDQPAAAILYLSDGERALLYNSGYDPAFGYYSSGLMLHALLIKNNIAGGIKIHDFLRGNERYKYDLGARDLNLYQISINLVRLRGNAAGH
ncbi:GNAT family N-acetyltransferase [Patescibacteria group bacterium]|nr:GNAT family N-acetyltransferase [Patescibacteria group bacterium]MCL5091900.1 GNAT family N-acetyltransferase [Patescibacteria group bacterium]